MGETFDRIRFVTPADLEASLGAELWSLGTFGFETRAAGSNRILIDAWFPVGAVPPGTFTPWRARDVEIERETIAAEDYLATYRAQAEPFTVGRRFILDSRDPDDCGPDNSDLEDCELEDRDLKDRDFEDTASIADGAADRYLLRIPARVAFGTGSHETTRVMLETLEEIDLSDQAVLDVGTGSGILSFACLRLGALSAIGFDLDAPSVLVARQNAALNPWPRAPAFFAGRLDAVASKRSFEVVLVNVLPERVRGEETRIAEAVAPGGVLVLAGALVRDAEAVLQRWTRLGLRRRAERAVGEWICWVLDRPN